MRDDKNSNVLTSDYYIIAFPSCDDYPTDKSSDSHLNSIRQSVSLKLSAFDSGVHCQLLELTQLVDEEMGDAYVVSIQITQSSELGVKGAAENFHPNAVASLLHSNAEVWITSGTSGPIPLAPPYGWNREIFYFPATAQKAICRFLVDHGVALVRRPVVSSDTGQQLESVSMMQLRDELQIYWTSLQEVVCKLHPDIELGVTEFGFQEFVSRGVNRFEVLLMDTNELFHKLRQRLEPQWTESVCQYLQSDTISHLRLHISCIYSLPGATDQEWHTDGDHLIGSNSEPYALCIFIPLIPLTQETGYTRFWPRSHKYAHLLGLGRAADAIQSTVDGDSLEMGDFILYDYTTWHRGTANMTRHTVRPILQFLYSLPWYKESRNYGTQSVHYVSPSRNQQMN